MQLHLIALNVETEVFEPEQQRHPGGAADTGEADAFAAQIFGPFDVGLSDEIEGVAAAEGSDDFQILTAGDGGQRGAAAGAADVDVTRGEAGDQDRGAANENRFDIDAIFVEQTKLLRHPERQRASARRGIAKDDSARRRGERRKERRQVECDYENNPNERATIPVVH